MSNVTRFRGPTVRPYIRKRFVDVEDGYLVDPDWDPDTWPSDLDPESASPYQALKYGPYAIGEQVLSVLSEAEQRRLGLCLVEGDCPGSSFCGVRFTGDVVELNKLLDQRDLHLLIRGEDPSPAQPIVDKG